MIFIPGKTIHRIFEEQVEKTPDRIAVVGMECGSPEDVHHITYRRLNNMAGQLARRLNNEGVDADSVVAIMVERSIEMIVGVLGILKAGGAYLPIDPEYPQDRIDYILADSNAKIVLRGNLKNVRAGCRFKSSLERALEGPRRGAPKGWGVSTLAHSPANLAYIIYTSGSTGRPKGVAVEHGSVVNILNVLFDAYPISPADGYLLKTSFLFDVSVSELFGWFMGGSRLIILEKDGEKDADVIIDTIERYGVTHINFVPVMFNAFTRRLLESDLQSIGKLSSLKYIFLAGEALVPELVRRFRQLPLNSPVRLENLYGPTEGTVYASGYSLSEWSGTGSIPIGNPLDNVELYILNSGGHPQPDGETGELCIAGAGVARGYLNNPELTAQKFGCGSTPLYHTGDLARLLPDGNIEYLGRMDHQVKIRGFRVELEEIESRLLMHKEIKEAVVIAGEDEKEDKYLCAYVVPNSPHSSHSPHSTKLREYLSQTLPHYMLPSFFVTMTQLPLTGSGKVDRKALPEPEIKSDARYIAPRDEIEKKLAMMWAKVLNVESIGIDDNFFEMGGHSLKGTALLLEVHKTFHVKLRLQDLFDMPVIRDLSAYIKKVAEDHFDHYLPLEPVELKEYYALSPAQKRVYILYQVAPHSTAYNIPTIFEIETAPGPDGLEHAFNKLIHRHESLRTSFIMMEKEPVQHIHDKVEFKISTGRGPYNSFISNFVRPFDLSRAPLMRAGLVEVADGKSLLMVDMHHIISDGISMEIFKDELTALYGHKELPPLPVQYKDFTQWQAGEKEKEKIEVQREYWLNKFTGDRLTVLNLPYDYPRPPTMGHEGKIITFEFSPSLSRALRDLARGANTTLFVVLAALYKILLARLNGQEEEVVIGSPASGRRHPDLAPIIGMFVNTLVLQSFPRDGKIFREFLLEMKQVTLEAFENQEFQFEELVELLDVERQAGRNPLFDVMFALDTIPTDKQENSGLTLIPYKYHHPVSKVDMILTGEEKEGVDESMDRLFFTLEYSTRLFKQDTVQRYTRYFKRIASAVITNPGDKIGAIEIISPGEKREILYDFNDTETNYPSDRTIQQLFAEQADKTPHAVSLVHMTNRSYMTHMTYARLNEESNRLAHLLIERGVASETIVGIMVEHSIEMPVGIIAILKAGGAYLPINPKNPAKRIKYMLDDSGAGLLLTQKRFTGSLEIPAELDVMVLEDDNLYPAGKENLKFRGIAGSLAYVIYTSGSTGNPKGVPITHSNFSPLVHWGYKHLGFGTADRVIRNLSYFFDWSVWEIFLTLTSGSSLYLAPEEEVLNPAAMVDFIRENSITVLHITPTQFRALIDMGEGSVKLGTLTYLCIGAEKLTYDLAKRSFETVSDDCRVFNMYGPTEAAIISAVLELDRDDEQKYRRLSGIPIGAPIANHKLIISDRYMNMCPVGVPGELYISGDGVTQGYLNRPELTAERFGRGAASYKRGAAPSYSTGDLARWLPGGDIEFLGRADHQLKIRGYRIELGEIENMMSKHGMIKAVVVTAVENEFLCAYFVPDVSTPDVSVSGLRDFLSRHLPAYMVPSFFVPIEKIPRTPNGKIDLKGLPIPGTGDAGVRYSPPETIAEKKLVEMWSAVLALSKETIGIDDNFFQLGGHSLKGAVLIAQIHKIFNVKISLADIFQTPDIRRLSAYIKDSVEDKYFSIEPVEKKEYYPLSSAQKRLYILDRLENESTGYNIPALYELAEAPDPQRLEDAFKQLIKRHESFRTCFIMVNDEPMQRIFENVEFEIEFRGVGDLPVPSPRPFDLSRAPLLRADLLKGPEGKDILFVDMHHTISDGVSMEIFQRELAVAYDSKELPPLKLQYKDYAGWQAGKARKEGLKEQETYWLSMYEGEIPVLNLPLDFARPVVRSFEGSNIRFELGKKETVLLKELARKEGTTLFTVLGALFNVLLSKLSGQEDIVVGSPAAGRRHSDLENMIGMFVNTLPLRNRPTGEKYFKGFIGEVKKRTLEVFENQDYQFEDLVERLSVVRDTARNPLFDVMFTMQNMEMEAAGDTGLKLGGPRYESDISKFDMTLSAFESAEGLRFELEYGTRLFKEETVNRFGRYFESIVSQVITNPGRQIGDIEIISEEEKRDILVDFNDTKTGYSSDKTIHQLFEEQVDKTPHLVSLVYMDNRSNRSYMTHMTYARLNEETGHLAHLLIEKGIKPGTVVGIMVPPSLEMMVGILAILKAGGAYLPIDPDYPEDRINYMLADSNAKIVLDADSQFKSPLERALEGPRRGAPKGWGVSTFAHSPANLAYIIYTSGSTGKPKGVAVEHRSVVNLLFSLFQAYPLGELDAYLMKTSFIFDVSVSELYGWFLGGGRLVIPGKDDHKDPRKIMAVVERTRVTHINFVPSMFNVFLEQLTSGIIGKLWSLKYIFLAGEALLPEQVRQFRELNSGIVLENIYGPTEATVYAAWYSLADWNGVGSVPIGKPLPNVRLYILDKRGCVQPVGVPGELCISGAGLARGYLNRPELTVDAFNKSYKSYRTYKTGDLARWWADGNIEFLGRIDHQVKIRGFRIELGEIESRLLSHEKIKEAVVIDRDRAGEKYLCAYIVGEIGDGGDVELLREYLGRTLPDYMIPALFIPLSEIPLTPSGKVDRKALPEPGSSGMQTGSDYISPRNDMEKRIAAIWQEVLGMEQIGIHDKFFNIGGNSLNVIRMNARLNRELGLSIPVVTMFRFPTINTLTRYLNPGEEPVETAVKPVEPDRSAKVSEGKSRRLQKLQKKRSSRI